MIIQPCTMLGEGRLSTTDIDKYLARCPLVRRHFLGTFPADVCPELPKEKPFCLVWNTDPSSMGGSHWVACIADTRGCVHYFDTTGSHPNSLIMNNINKMGARKKFVVQKAIQPFLSDMCGQYCIYFIINWKMGRNLKFIISRFSTKNTARNDAMVKQWLDTHSASCVHSD